MPPLENGDDRLSGPWFLPKADLDDGVERARADLTAIGGARILVTGGTGFLGRWIVSSLLRANEMMDSGCHVVVLTRRPDSLRRFAGPSLSLLEGDVRCMPDPGPVDLVVHGAAASSSAFGAGEGEAGRMAATIVEGTDSVLRIARRYRARVLFLSSGAVYGAQCGPVSEDSPSTLDPLDLRSAYGEAKRFGENMCAVAAATGEIETVAARLFAFVGPGIPLDAHFAAGNFLNDLLHSRPIVVQGNGRPRRSLLYVGDLPEWCWALLSRGRGGAAYNVGSPEAVTIEELARRTASLAHPRANVEVLGARTGGPDPWYVPSITRAQTELGLQPSTALDSALQRTFSWLSEHPHES